MKYSALCIAVAVGLAPIGVVRAGDDPPGLYAGASIGRSEMHLSRDWTLTPSGTDEVVVRQSGWSVSVGVRPVRLLGAELQYLDFGNAHYNFSGGNTPFGFSPPVSTAVHTNAEALVGVIYAPIPVPLLDVYAKVGPAHWHSTVNGQIQGLFCPVFSPNCGLIASSLGRTDLLYGAGMQFKFGHVALRTEYERLNANPEYPNMYLLGLTWTF